MLYITPKAYVRFFSLQNKRFVPLLLLAATAREFYLNKQGTVA
jgi:hypothetical protein